MELVSAAIVERLKIFRRSLTIWHSNLDGFNAFKDNVGANRKSSLLSCSCAFLKVPNDAVNTCPLVESSVMSGKKHAGPWITLIKPVVTYALQNVNTVQDKEQRS